ncbi:MAG: MFS transporter [Actinomycetota bacterium]
MNNKRAFGLLQVTNAVSGISNGVVMITVPWIVLELTGSAAKAGLLAALSSLPGIFVSPVVGGLIDRFGRRAISMFSDVMSMISVLMFLVINAVGDLTYSWILIIAVLGACFDPAGYTARKALIPNAATASGIEIDSANGRHEGIFAIGWMVGPAIGSACIKWSGPMLAFAVTAVMFAAATIAVSLMHVDDEHGKTVAHHEDGHESFFASLREGFHALTRDKPLFALAIGFMFLSGLYMPIDTVIFPTYFESINNATGLGALFASLAAGMVIGSFAYGRLAARFSASALLRIVMIVSTASLMPMVILPPTWLFVVLGFFAGLSWGPFNPLWNSIVQKRVQPELQGRVYGLQMSLLYAAPPLGQLIVGASVDHFGLQSTFVVVMAVFGLVGFTFAATPILRKL